MSVPWKLIVNYRTAVFVLTLIGVITFIRCNISFSPVYTGTIINVYTEQTQSYLLYNATRTKEKFFLVVGIPSMPTPKHAATRRVIRETWANVSGWHALSGMDEEYLRVKVLFIIGHMPKGEFSNTFLDEVEREEDIHIPDLLEDRTVLKYKNLWMFRRAVDLFDFSYYVKTDDDIAVNLPLLIRDLIILPRTNLYAGRCLMRFGGFRGWLKWVYCSGGGYVLSRDVVEKINTMSPEVHNTPFRPEDGYTGYLVKLLQNQGVPIQKRFVRHALSMAPYRCGPIQYWFYHQCFQPDVMAEQFRIFNNNLTVVCGTEAKG